MSVIRQMVHLSMINDWRNIRQYWKPLWNILIRFSPTFFQPLITENRVIMNGDSNDVTVIGNEPVMSKVCWLQKKLQFLKHFLFHTLSNILRLLNNCLLVQYFQMTTQPFVKETILNELSRWIKILNSQKRALLLSHFTLQMHVMAQNDWTKKKKTVAQSYGHVVKVTSLCERYGRIQHWKLTFSWCELSFPTYHQLRQVYIN